MGVDEGEHGGDEADFFRWVVGAFAAAGSRALVGVRVLTCTSVGEAVFAVCSFSAALSAHALGDAVGVDVASGDFAAAWTCGEFTVEAEEGVLFVWFVVAGELGDGGSGAWVRATGGFRCVFIVRIVG